MLVMLKNRVNIIHNKCSKCFTIILVYCKTSLQFKFVSYMYRIFTFNVFQLLCKILLILQYGHDMNWRWNQVVLTFFFNFKHMQCSHKQVNSLSPYESRISWVSQWSHSTRWHACTKSHTINNDYWTRSLESRLLRLIKEIADQIGQEIETTNSKWVCANASKVRMRNGHWLYQTRAMNNIIFLR